MATNRARSHLHRVDVRRANAGVQTSVAGFLLAFICLSVVEIATGQRPDPGKPRSFLPHEVAVPIDETTLQRQYATLSAMSLTEVIYNKNGLLQTVRGHTGLVIPNRKTLKKGDVSADIAEKLRPILLTTGSEVLTVDSNRYTESRGIRNIVLTQTIHGLPVKAGWLGLVVEEQSGEIVELLSRVIPDRGLPREPKISATEAKRLAALYIENSGWAEAKSVEVYGEPELAYFAGSSEARKPTLVWALNVGYLTADRPPPATPAGTPVSRQIFIDAVQGDYLDQLAVSLHAPRSVYSANNVATPLGGFPNGLTFLFGEGQFHPDVIALKAYDNVGITQSAWGSAMQDAISSPLGIVVYWGPGAAAASAPGSGGQYWMAFAGGNSTYRPASDDLDTVAHEFGHGMARNYVNAIPSANEQAASINEAWADLSAVITDIAYRTGPNWDMQTWELHQMNRADPLISTTSWWAPKTRGIYWADYYPTRNIGLDADVHYNSTIMGLAFRLLVTGGLHPRAGQGGITNASLTGIGEMQAKRIFWEALRVDPTLRAFPTFHDVKQATVSSANALYGPTAADRTTQAWNAVGVTDCTGQSPPAPPAGTLEDLLCAGRYTLSWPDVPGATTYHAERVRSGYPWSLATTIVDGDVNQCSGQVGQTTRFRMRACNACGCSDYQNLGTVQFWSPCP